MYFSELNISETLKKNILDVGFNQPTEVQENTIPAALEGNDISAIAKTGTGKTAAFLIPVIESISRGSRLVICLAPTRELATQIETQAIKLINNLPITTANLIGGMPLKQQIDTLQAGAQLIIGTPGRIMDMVRDRHLDLQSVDVLVFDEADRMFDMGFIQDMQFILRKTNRKRQILLFSATMNFSVQNMVYEYGGNPIEFNLSRDQITAEGIKQEICYVADEEKPHLLIGLFRKFLKAEGTAIIFVNYKDKVEHIVSLLKANDFSAKGLSSLLRQDQRSKILTDFRAGKLKALVATDVASRGIDVDDVRLVINYHLPEEASNYVHRIGRTARAGRQGAAISIAGSEDAYNQLRIEDYLGYKIPNLPIGDDDIPKDVILPELKSYKERHMGDDASRSNSKTGRSTKPGNKRNSRSNRRVKSADPKKRNTKDGTSRRNQQNRKPKRDYKQKPVKDLFPEAAELPTPITGNPIIYDMKTGTVKSSSDDSGLLKRFGSKVGSIFSNKK